MSTRPPWPARWGIVDRPTVTRYDISLADNPTDYVSFGVQGGQTDVSTRISLMTGTAVGVAKAFTVGTAGMVVTSIDWRLRQDASPDGTLVARVYENDGTVSTPDVGTLVATSDNSVNAADLSTAAFGAWETFSFLLALDAGEYIAAVERVSATTGDVDNGRSTTPTIDSGELTEDPDGTWASHGDFGLSLRLNGYAGQSYDDGVFVRKTQDDEIFAIDQETDPTDIFGIAAEGSGEALETGFVMVYELEANDWYGMMGTRDPVEGDIDTAYGIKQDSNGNWIVDLTETTNTRVTVEDVDLNQNYYLVSFLTAHIQS